MQEWIRSQIAIMAFDVSTLRKIELASEEALVNIINHAYKDHPGIIEIHILVYPKNYVEIQIRDKGPPFDPLQHEVKIDKNAPLEERKEGGLGIMMIRKYMDEVHYRRDHDTNILILIKKRKI